MKDRAMQALHLSALEPVAETTADPNSYGFRRSRACRDAAGQLFLNLAKKKAPEWVLDADIAGCFDNISHEWLIANIPMDKKILGSWLKTGFVENQQWFPTEVGAPQGGIISPTLANMTLNGMEKAVKDGIADAISIKEAKTAKVNVVRYADDFIVTGATQRHLAIIVNVVEGFLGERGLTLSPEKTRTAHIDDGFDFLGWNIRKYGGKLLIKPAKRNVQNLLLKVRGIIKVSGAMQQEALIGRLNPIIGGWANYHAGQVSKETYSKVDDAIWQGLWKWAGRRHPTKNTQWIKDRYFHREGSRDWVFGIKESGGGRTVIRSKLIKAVDTPIRRHIKIKAAANPFDPDWEPYFEERETAAMKKSLIGRVQTLWEKQDGKCPACNQQIRETDEWHVHHKIPKYLGGDDKLTNLTILHPNCHRQVHAKYKLDELPAL
jgi:RNA-directed DNA polymerase